MSHGVKSRSHLAVSRNRDAYFRRLRLENVLSGAIWVMISAILQVMMPGRIRGPVREQRSRWKRSESLN
eukprot:1355402-Amorphochlora_amoeboformis.AAC.1